jgi:hypothetical protein
MPILDNAPIQDRKRLLELFPIAIFREVLPELKGTKEEVCYAYAALATPAQVGAFVRTHFGRCKQHVYIFNRPDGTVALPNAVTSGEKIAGDGNEGLYIIRTSYRVVLRDPLEEMELEFLWPVLVQVKGHHIIVRFVALEKDVSSYFERQCYVVRKSIEEKTVLADLNLGNARTDLHKGIKTMWDEKFMDSPRTKFKKPMSMASEAMDEELGIRAHNPELYATLLDSVLLNTLFVIEEAQHCGTSAFLADCVNGFLAFPRYSEAERNTDFVIDEILRHNQ